jgi:DNA-binding NtrC family response regulator
MNVLVVDDEAIVRDILATILTDNGFEVRTAESGQEGLRLLAEMPADFLITDLLMPHMSGTELLARVKQVRPDTRVIIMSGHVDFDGSIPASVPDAYAVLCKPFDFRHLIDLLAGTPKPQPDPPAA